MLRILINKGGIELHNRINVSVYPVWNISVSIRYKTLLDTWKYEYFDSIKVMQRFSPYYLEHCLITVTLDRQTFDVISEFDHKDW
jgi:hypothetical protein